MRSTITARAAAGGASTKSRPSGFLSVIEMSSNLLFASALSAASPAPLRSYVTRPLLATKPNVERISGKHALIAVQLSGAAYVVKNTA